NRRRPEVARGDGRMLAARPLAGVLPPDDEVAAGVPGLDGACGIGLVDDVEGELGHLGDVAAEGKDARTGRHDLVGRDVVAHLEQHRPLDAIGQGSKSGSDAMLGPLTSSTSVPDSGGASIMSAFTI